MINIILTYILIGVVLTAALDALADKLENTPTLQKAMDEWGIRERIMNVVMWPISLFIFIYAFTKKL